MQHRTAGDLCPALQNAEKQKSQQYGFEHDLHMNLLTEQRCVYNTDDRMARILQADPELIPFLYAGANLQEGQPIPEVTPKSACR